MMIHQPPPGFGRSLSRQSEIRPRQRPSARPGDAGRRTLRHWPTEGHHPRSAVCPRHPCMPTAIEDRIVVTDALGTQVKIKSEVFRDHSPSATARSSAGGTTSTRSPSSTHSAGRLAELVKHRPVRPSRDFYPERDGGDCTWPTACLQPVCPTCGFLARIGHAQPAHRSAHANRRPARLRPVGRARLRQRRTGCPEHCRRPTSTTSARRIVGDLISYRNDGKAARRSPARSSEA